ncbi:unnamed protein product [Symbiodinium natans]|uniref:Uncharacterized protein n=1 Tax=Symbiodinium natans TaxID=878477 RepID=A0A812UT90_9DINO|nr:unnamed protein product [Symbiodinium natans]
MPDAASVADDSRQILIDQVKSHQKASAAFQKAWHAYCDEHGDGIYDPARHKIQLLEEFLKTAASKVAGSKRKRKEATGSGSESSRSRTRRRRRHGKGRRRAHGRRHRRDRRRRDHRGRRRRKGRRKRSRSRSSSGSSERSGLPSRATAIKGAERAVAAAAEELSRLKADPDAGVDNPAIDEKQKEEMDNGLRTLQREADAELQAQLEEVKEKLAREKVSRLVEAEEKLDQAISERLKEAEDKLRQEAQGRIDEARNLAQAKVEAIMADARPKIESSWLDQLNDLESKARAARAAADALTKS